MREPVTRWPSPPGVLAEVIRLTSAPDPDLPAIARAIQADPALTTQLLASVNSGYYSTRAPITTVERAVSFLGGAALRSLVLCLLLPRLASKEDVGDYPLDPYWEASLRRAVAGVQLAKRVGLAAPAESFTVGLVQDIGVLLQLMNDASQASFFNGLEGLPAVDRLTEERMTGISHDEVGAQLLLQWQLPEALVAPVRFHHDPELSPRALRTRCAVACVAEHVADLWSCRDKREALDLAETNLERVGLPPEALGELVDVVNAEVTEAAARFGFHVWHGATYEELAGAAEGGVVYSHRA